MRASGEPEERSLWLQVGQVSGMGPRLVGGPVRLDVTADVLEGERAVVDGHAAVDALAAHVDNGLIAGDYSDDVMLPGPFVGAVHGFQLSS